jgi:hypothetical protein
VPPGKAIGDGLVAASASRGLPTADNRTAVARS